MPLISSRSTLGPYRSRVDDRVGVLHAGQHLVGIDGVVPVEGDQDRGSRVDALEAVEVVGQRGLVALGLETVVVPASPGPSLSGQQAGVGVQGGPVGLVAKRTERLTLHPVGVRQESQGLIAVGGEHDVVVGFDVRPHSPPRLHRPRGGSCPPGSRAGVGPRCATGARWHRRSASNHRRPSATSVGRAR